MFSTAFSGGKAFAVEQKIRELKNRIFRLKTLKKEDKNKMKMKQIIIKANR